jgi:hypothetical protein
MLIYKTYAYLGVRCLAMYNLLYQMAALVLSSLSLVFLYKLQIINYRPICSKTTNNEQQQQSTTPPTGIRSC